MQSKLMNALLAIRSGLKREERTCDNYEIPFSVTQLVGSNLAYDEEESSGAETVDCDFILPELVQLLIVLKDVKPAYQFVCYVGM